MGPRARHERGASRFEESVLPHLDSAYNLARWLTRNGHDAEDLVQDALLRAFRAFPGFRGADGRAWPAPAAACSGASPPARARSVEMNCQENRVLLHAFLDDELDPVRSLSVQSHLDACPDCAREHAAQRSLRAALRDEALYFRSPEGFESRVRAALASQGAIKRRAGWPSAVGALLRMRWAWLPAGAAVALLAVIVITIGRFGTPAPGSTADDLLGREVVASHLRSLMANHLTDVPSSDQHTVKPWFNGRLDFSPPVKDLAGEGFALMGGRLDYLAGRPGAGP